SETSTASRGAGCRPLPTAFARVPWRSSSSRSGPAFSRPTAAIRSRISARRGSGSGGTGARPHLLEIVEFAHFRAEDVNDHVAGVDQHPVAMRQAFDTHLGDTALLQRLDDVLRHGP